MFAAFEVALKLVSSFIAKYPDSYPPIILNITDGRPSDADPQPLIKELRKLHTTDGSALLFNLHLSAVSSSQYLFPGICPKTDDPYSTYLFRSSSLLPKAMLDIARMQYPTLDDDARGFAYNADFVSLVQFLNIGTTCAV